MSELKRCPICGSDVQIRRIEESNFYRINCSYCPCSFEAYDRDDVIKEWNTRTPIEKVLERLEELKMAEYDDSDEEPSWTDVEEWYDAGVSEGKYKAYYKAIEIIKEEVG